MDQHQPTDGFADLQVEMHRSRLAWLTVELRRRGSNEDPVEVKRKIDQVAAQNGVLYMRGGWYLQARLIIEVRAAVKHVIDAVLSARSAGLIPPPIPEDPRERALYLRKHRNTGPAKRDPGVRRQRGGTR